MQASPLFGLSGILNPLTERDSVKSIPAGYGGLRKESAAKVTLS